MSGKEAWAAAESERVPLPCSHTRGPQTPQVPAEVPSSGHGAIRASATTCLQVTVRRTYSSLLLQRTLNFSVRTGEYFHFYFLSGPLAHFLTRPGPPGAMRVNYCLTLQIQLSSGQSDKPSGGQPWPQQWREPSSPEDHFCPATWCPLPPTHTQTPTSLCWGDGACPRIAPVKATIWAEKALQRLDLPLLPCFPWSISPQRPPISDEGVRWPSMNAFLVPSCSSCPEFWLPLAKNTRRRTQELEAEDLGWGPGWSLHAVRSVQSLRSPSLQPGKWQEQHPPFPSLREALRS